MDKEIRQSETSGEILDQEKPIYKEKEIPTAKMSDEAKWEEWREKARKNRKMRKKPEMSVAELSQREKGEDDTSNVINEDRLSDSASSASTPGLTDEMDFGEVVIFRTEVEMKVLSLEVRPSKNLQRKMQRFDRKLEEAVGRMAQLGCIDETSEHDEDTLLNVSEAEDSKGEPTDVLNDVRQETDKMSVEELETARGTIEEPRTDAGLSLAPNYEPEMSEAKWVLSELGQNSELKSKL